MNNDIIQNLEFSQVALWTPPGRGAVATICYHGDPKLIDSCHVPLFQAVNKKSLSAQTVGDIIFGHWRGEEVVLCRTNSKQLMIHCHGGDVAVMRIMDDLASLHVEVIEWMQLIGNSESQFDADMREILSRTKTIRSANIVLQQQSGLLYSALTKLLPVELQQQWANVIKQIDHLLKWSQFGLHLTIPWQVVIAGRPNVGKSSLINKLAGFERAIVFDQPGTTRDVVRSELVFDGWLLEVTDTAGIRSEAISLEQEGIERTFDVLQQADCQVILLDQSQPLTNEDHSLLRQFPKAIIVANKSDLSGEWNPTEWSQTEIKSTDVLSISANTSQGIDDLCDRIINALIPEVPAAHTPVPVTLRQIEFLQKARYAAEQCDLTQYLAAIESLIC